MSDLALWSIAITRPATAPRSGASGKAELAFDLDYPVDPIASTASDLIASIQHLDPSLQIGGKGLIERATYQFKGTTYL